MVLALHGLEQARGHGGGEGEGHDGGDDHGAADGDGELDEEAAGLAGLEGERDEDGDERERDGDDGDGDFLHGLVRGLHGVQALLDVPVDGLEHDDGVVHDDTDREHEGEHGKDVDRVPEEVEDGEGGDDGDGDGNGGDERGAEVPEEDEDDEDDEEEGDEERVPDLGDGLLDIDGLVVGDAKGDAGVDLSLQPGHLRADAAGDGHGVGLGLLDDAKEHGGKAVGPGGGAVVLDALLGAADVQQADHGGAVGADDQLVELGGGLELAAGEDGHFAVEVLDASGGELDVLLAEGALDIKDGDAARGHACGVEPEAHGEAFLAADDDGGDAGDGLEAGLDDAFGDGAELERGMARAVHGDPEDGLGVRVLLGHDGLEDVVGKGAADAADAVANVLGGEVDLAGELELDGDVGDLLAGLGGEGADALDVVDGFLKALRDLGLDDLGVGAGIDGGDGDDGRVDVRQLADGQSAKGDEAEEHEREVEHRGQDGALDGDAAEEHGMRVGEGGLGPSDAGMGDEAAGCAGWRET